ncbi:MAG: hypothetical protein OXG99_14800 [Alphaproteobacteria bacterium]|nr:hypothetical protein [Alphaproteobacteria bacterium]
MNTTESTRDGGIKFTGGDGDDKKNGTDRNDILRGKGGNDEFRGLGGDDKLYGGNGTDTLYGGDGNDFIDGWKGDDSLYGGDGNDTLKGHTGADKLHGGAGNDKLYGGAGADIFVFDSKDFGRDTIEDFSTRSDKLDFTGSGLSLADLKIEEKNGDTVLTVRETGSTITLKGLTGVTKETLTEFAPPDNIVGLEGIYGTDGGEDGIGREALTGTEDGDKIFGLAGHDRILGNGGNDEIYGGMGGDTLYGGDGDDTLYGGTGNDTLDGGAGGDTFVFDSKTFGADTIEKFSVTEDKLDFTDSGLSWADLKIEEKNGDTVMSVAGTEHKITLEGMTGVAGSGLPSWIVGLVPPEGKNEVRGTDDDNRLIGTRGDDVVYGFAGDDVIYALDGDDWLYGGTGVDSFAYGSVTFGNDVIKDFEAGENGDVLDFTGAGLDYKDLQVALNDGDVTVTVRETGSTITLEGVGAEQSFNIKGLSIPDSSPTKCLVGTDGADTMIGDGGLNFFCAGDGKDTLYGQGHSDYLYGGADDDKLHGGAGRDFLLGGAGNDDLYGGSDIDHLFGHGGDDWLYGGAGNDLLEGGTGDDTLYGGAGADQFLYVNGPFGDDVIKDFEDGTDKLDFVGAYLTRRDLEIENNADGHAVVTMTKNGEQWGRITVEGVTADQLTDADFLFA